MQRTIKIDPSTDSAPWEVWDQSLHTIAVSRSCRAAMSIALDHASKGRVVYLADRRRGEVDVIEAE